MSSEDIEDAAEEFEDYDPEPEDQQFARRMILGLIVVSALATVAMVYFGHLSFDVELQGQVDIGWFLTGVGAIVLIFFSLMTLKVAGGKLISRVLGAISSIADNYQK